MARRKLLLVEGPDDEHVVKNLCGKRQGPWIDEIATHAGISALLEAIPSRVKASEGDHIIGIVVDADESAAARWQSIWDRLSQQGYPDLPRQPAEDGMIIDPPADSRLSRLGVWIMPDNRSSGVLENFLHRLVPEESRLYAHVQSSVAAIPPDAVKFSQLAKPKVLLHTWLACQADPGNPYGLAIKCGDLNPDSPEVDAFVAWLKRLYSDNAI